MASYPPECVRRVDEFVSVLASLVARDVREGAPRLTVGDVLRLAQESSRDGGCGADIPLKHVYQVAAKLAVDKAMEALSTHMESLDEHSYAALSHIVTMYAFHTARLAASALELASMEGVDSGEAVLEAFEPVVFASLARVMALARAVATMESSELAKLTQALERVVAGYVSEENELVRGLVGFIAR